MYMFRAYQSPISGADCGPQCAQMPNLASRNHSGHWYCLSDSLVGWNGPGAIKPASAIVAGAGAAARARDCHRGALTPAAAANAEVLRNLRRVSLGFHAWFCLTRH